MCLSKTPTYKAPEIVQPQEAKAPMGLPTTAADARKRMAPGMAAGSTLLTGPSGIESRQLSLGQSTVLGR